VATWFLIIYGVFYIDFKHRSCAAAAMAFCQIIVTIFASIFAFEILLRHEYFYLMLYWEKESRGADWKRKCSLLWRRIKSAAVRSLGVACEIGCVLLLTLYVNSAVLKALNGGFAVKMAMTYQFGDFSFFRECSNAFVKFTKSDLGDDDDDDGYTYDDMDDD
jgi:hypothetical protein